MSVPIYDVTIAQLTEWSDNTRSPFKVDVCNLREGVYVIAFAYFSWMDSYPFVRLVPTAYTDRDMAVFDAEILDDVELDYVRNGLSRTCCEHEVWHIVCDFELYEDMELYKLLCKCTQHDDVISAIEVSL